MGATSSVLESFFGFALVAGMLLGLFFGTALMRVVRKAYGARAYWFLGVLITGSLLFAVPQLFIIVGSIWMTLGLYMELESKGARWTTSALVGILMGMLFCTGTTIIAFVSSGVHSLAEAQALMTQFAEKLHEANPEAQLEAGMWFQLIPSATVMILIVALATGLMFERRAYSWLKVPREKVASQLKLLEFRLPDYMIWVAMVAFLLTVENGNVKALEILGRNLVYIMGTLYFFQGLAILEVTLRTFKAGPLFRAAVYIILITQMVPLVAVGVVDYWVDFRKRLRNMRLSSKTN